MLVCLTAMTWDILQSSLILGQAQGGTPAQAPNIFTFLMPWILIFGLFYFLFIMPQKKTQKLHQKMLEDLKPGDRIMTKGGLRGTVAQTKEEVLVLKLAEGVKVEIGRSYVESKLETPS